MSREEKKSKPLDPVDQNLLNEIRHFASITLDRHARWEALHDRVVEAKKHQLHRKLGLGWNEFLRQVGVTPDDWSRVLLAVEICRPLQQAGLPPPENHGQIEKLRAFRNEPSELVHFWKKLLNENLGVPPPAVIIESAINGRQNSPSPRKHPPPTPATAQFPEHIKNAAAEYLEHLSRGELFEAQAAAQRIAAFVLGKPNDVTSTRIWPVPHRIVKQLEWAFGDPTLRIPKSHAKESSPDDAVDRQTLLDFDSAKLAESLKSESQLSHDHGSDSELHAKSANNIADASADSTPAAAPTNPMGKEIREIRGDSDPAAEAHHEEAGPALKDDAPAIVGATDSAGLDSSQTEAPTVGESPADLGAASNAEIRELRGVQPTISETAPAAPGDAIPSQSAQSDSSAQPAPVPCADSTMATAGVEESHLWLEKPIELASEFRLHGAKAWSSAFTDHRSVRIEIKVLSGTSRWVQSCPTPPFFTRTEVPGGWVFARELHLIGADEISRRVTFAVYYMGAGGRLETLRRFCDEDLVNEAEQISGGTAA